MVGIDRLDYTKGIPRRLLAFEQLLINRPNWRGRVRLVQVAVPSRTGVRAYRRFRHEVDGLVGHINGLYGTPHWTPVHYLYRSVPETQLLALYRAADVMLVTPVRDGMNLVSKEFVATRFDEQGVLVLSEFAGAAAQMDGAVLVNPFDVETAAQRYHEALIMPASERAGRMRRLRQHVFDYDVHRWTREFLGDLIPEDKTTEEGPDLRGSMHGRSKTLAGER
jgi:trehalose 6-phosphate synthase/phosphatase